VTNVTAKSGNNTLMQRY